MNHTGDDASSIRPDWNTYAEPPTTRSEKHAALGEFRKSWPLLCVAMFGLCVGAMAESTIGVFIIPLSQAFGWSLSAISALSIFTGLGVMLGGPIQGRLLDRFGFRRIVLWSIPSGALTLVLTNFVGSNIWTLYCAMFFWGFVLSGFSSYYVRSVGGWFDAGRGTAIGLIFAAGGIGSTIAPAATQWIIGHQGWRMGFLSLAVAGLLAWPFTYVWLRNPKADAPHRIVNEASSKTGLTRGEAMRTPVFWLNCGASLLSGLMLGGIFFLAPFLIENGMSREAAAYCVSLVFGAGVVGQPIWGAVNDRVRAPYVATIAFLLFFTAFVIFGFFGSQYAVLATIITGVSMSGFQNATFHIVPRYFGFRNFGEISGLIFSIRAAAGMIGPLTFSLMRDATGSYKLSYVAMGVVAIAAAGCMFLAGRYPFIANLAKNGNTSGMENAPAASVLLPMEER